MASLLYSAGLRLLEYQRRRVKAFDFASHQILLYEGKGNKERRTMLPAAVHELLRLHLETVAGKGSIAPWTVCESEEQHEGVRMLGCTILQPNILTPGLSEMRKSARMQAISRNGRRLVPGDRL
jgi:hypothetical protein